MAFWKKSIELPDAFYKAAGECFLYYMESHVMAQKLQASFMTFDQACELLDLVKEGEVRLRDLIAQYPIKSDLSLELRENMNEGSIQSCEERKKAILALSDFDRSLPINQFGGNIEGLDAAHFERGVIGNATNFMLTQDMAMKRMAKSANISLNDFNKHAMQTVKDTPRGKLVLGQARTFAAAE
jgi:phosphoenolpyruvate synthase/pyruvate phosphate dikinase